ncbi:MAG TPA: hypothetical protein VIL01_15445 [Thermomicrobiales bacterium]
MVEQKASAASAARRLRPSIGDQRLRELERLKAECVKWGIEPKFRYQPQAPTQSRWQCVLYLLGRGTDAPLCRGVGSSEQEALVRALKHIKNRLLAQRKRQADDTEDEAVSWSPRLKRADHFDNIAYAIWPIEEADDT